MARTIFDAAVIGLGTMGTFACLELARRGLRVIGLDQFAPPHDRGSHTGDTRVFRAAYAEHPDYVPLALRAGVLWDKMGADRQTTFLHRTGMLSLGSPESALVCGTLASAAAHDLSVEQLTPAQIRSSFPVFQVPAGWEGVFEPSAGWIDVNASLRYGLAEAARAGAELRLNTRVEDWAPAGGGFEIRTSDGTVLTKRLVITAGAWAGRILSDLALPLKVIRKVLVWLNPLRPVDLPVFASARQFFYGFPNIGDHGVKLAIHWSEGAPAAATDSAQPEAGTDEIKPILEHAEELLPAVAGPLPGAFQQVIRTKTCFYTMTPDEHFLIDRHPRFDGVCFAAGFSGHGFKFAPAIGEALADLAVTGRSELPIGFLSLKRFQAELPGSTS